ncbi:MAG: PD-(D/E)XK nuclease family protein, partial [Candidatus Coatesbacteria bacterium]|nr:PD-(D/E)XK nuclease family protein [Candidatus Coatesbacteria bacterium]
FIVGDERQSIYAFRGANLKAFRDTVAEIESSGGSTIEMRENFRSLPDLIAFINRLFGEQAGQHGFSEAPMIAKRSVGEGVHHGTVELLFPASIGNKKENVAVEAGLIARRIVAMVDPKGEFGKSVVDPSTNELRSCRYDDIAMLLQKRTHLQTYKEALRQLGVPFIVVGGFGFGERQEILDVLCLLRAISDQSDDLALAGVLRSPLFAVSDDGLAWFCAIGRAECSKISLWKKLIKLAKEGVEAVAPWESPPPNPLDAEALLTAHSLLSTARQMSRTTGPAEIVRFMLNKTAALAAYAAQTDGDQCLANLNKIDDLLKSSTSDHAIPAAIRRLADLFNGQVRVAEAQVEERSGDGVKIMTIHAAKGLEFPVVMAVDAFDRPFWGGSEAIYADPELGLGIMVPSASVWGKRVPTQIRQAISDRLKQANSDEYYRLWYVACTRARDHILISGTPGAKPGEAIGWEINRRFGIDSPTPDSAPSRIEVEGIKNPLLVFSSESQLPGGLAPDGQTQSRTRAYIERLKEAADAEFLKSGPISQELGLMKCIGQAEFTPDISPSDLDTFSECPRRYLIERILNAEALMVPPTTSADKAAASASGAEFGTTAHRLLQLVDPDDQSGDDALISSLLKANESGVQREALSNILRIFRSSELAQRAASARRARREVPFILKLDQAVLRGMIDLLLEDEAGHISIVDYKTDMETEGIIERYRAQMAAYWVAASALRPTASAISVSIYLARTGEILPVQIDADALARVESVVRDLRAAKECALKRPLFDCYQANRAACDACFFRTKLLCNRLGRK